MGIIIGIDEAGRGPVTGPLVIAALGADENELKLIEKLPVRDSKQLTPKQRDELRKKIIKVTKNFYFSIIPATEIDAKRKVMSLNELEALKTAELIEKFSDIAKVIIDLPDPRAEQYKRRIRKYTNINDFEIIAEHKADQNYKICSAASILAKEKRDELIREIEKKHGIVLGTGYSHDENTIKTLNRYADRKETPDFVRYSWETARRIWDKINQKKLFDF